MVRALPKSLSESRHIGVAATLNFQNHVCTMIGLTDKVQNLKQGHQTQVPASHSQYQPETQSTLLKRSIFHKPPHASLIHKTEHDTESNVILPWPNPPTKMENGFQFINVDGGPFIARFYTCDDYLRVLEEGQRQNPAVQKTRFRQIMSKGHSHSNRKMDPDPITSKLVPHWSSTKSLLVGHVNSICQKHRPTREEETRLPDKNATNSYGGVHLMEEDGGQIMSSREEATMGLRCISGGHSTPASAMIVSPVRVAEAKGFAGDIWCYWKSIIELQMLSKNDQCISLGVMRETKVAWLLTIIYASHCQIP
ncbi:hypothetical protein M9H77_15768 [Catharanthus roseus]|uniref:Uncharacterized protein n=1 Tax=Catharanthus roseus TaxID=4058 RepID=A0ACC0B002_CATRO|nr:hypothetical protein M9H77_15768 [Catharanthus roseus]